MKKIILLLFTFIFFLNFNINVNALSKYSTEQNKMNTMSNGIEEDFDYTYSGRYLDSITATYTIPENYCEKEIYIVPSIFEKMGELTYVLPGTEIVMNFKIINNSNCNYEYENKSFVISTEDLSSYNLAYNTNAIGFNNNKIFDMFRPYRTGNTALKSLYGSKFSKATLEDNELEEYLKNNGYKGISELNKYYLDFYNNKYKLNETKLENFNDKILAEMFDGNKYKIRENNKEIVETSYDWFYNKLFSITFEDDKYSDEDSEKYSIGQYMRNNDLINNKFLNYITNIQSKQEYSIDNMVLHINGPYTVNTYQTYSFSAYMGMKFNLIKEIEEEINTPNEKNIESVNNHNDIQVFNSNDESEDIIIPPNTGLDKS